MKNILSLFLLLISVTFSAFTAQGQIKKHEVNVGDFSELIVADNLRVSYRCVPDSAGMAVFSAEPARVPSLVFESNKQKLKIYNDSQLPDSIFGEIVVYSNALTNVTNWGDELVVVDSIAPIAKFKARVVGNGKITARHIHTSHLDAAVQAGRGRVYVSGTTKTATFQLLSTGSIEAGDMQAARVKCRMYGTGSVDCCVTDALNVAGLSSGTVYYRGDAPDVKNRSVGVKIVKVD